MSVELKVGDKVNVTGGSLDQFPGLLYEDTVGTITRIGKTTCNVTFNNSDLDSVALAEIKKDKNLTKQRAVRSSGTKTSTFAFDEDDLEGAGKVQTPQPSIIPTQPWDAMEGSPRMTPMQMEGHRKLLDAGMIGGKRRPKRRKTHRTKKRKASKKKKKTKRKKSKTRRKRR